MGLLSEEQLQLGEDAAFRTLQSAWQSAVQVLSAEVDRPSFESWVKTARPVSISEHVVTIGATSGFGRRWLETKHLPLITQILAEHLGYQPRIKIEVLKEPVPAIMAEKLPPKPKARHEEEPISQPLNSRYTFDTFVVGPTNRLAHACAQSVAVAPGKTYNPLFIYGGAGLGKTHLMHAVGQFAIESSPGLRVVYVSGETFTYHYITALREHRTAEFRRKYRSVDLWLVDDIHFLVGKERTEEEFFHTYNAIYEMGKQIVLTSDRAPKDLDLDGRLLSRFECGMLADVSPPDLETRMAILQAKAALENMALPNEVILYIARLITSNIRQLEGALIKLHAYASLMRTSVTATLAEEVLGKYYGDGTQRVINVPRIQQEVARRFNIALAELKGNCRERDIVVPRQVAMYLARQMTDSSLPAIGKAFGGKDHSTVLHACKKIEERLARDRAFVALLEEISTKIRNGSVG